MEVAIVTTPSQPENTLFGHTHDLTVGRRCSAHNVCYTIESVVSHAVCSPRVRKDNIGTDSSQEITEFIVAALILALATALIFFLFRLATTVPMV